MRSIAFLGDLLSGLTGALTGALLLGGCAQDDANIEHPGKQTYTRYCFSCHQSGVAGAPALGRAEDWLERVGKGRPALVKSVLDGIAPAMPPKGLCNSCTEAELGDAVDFMLGQLESVD